MQDRRRDAAPARRAALRVGTWFHIDHDVVARILRSGVSPPVNPPFSDHELVRRVIAREPTACEEYVQRMRCVPRIVDAMNRAAGRPLDADDAADLAQHTITEVLAHLPQFPPHGILDRWVFCFCRNSFLNRVRKHWRRATTPLDAVAEPSQSDPSRDEMIDIALFHEAFALLSPDERALIEARNLDDLTFDEIARRWNIPASTLKTRHGVAIERLRRRLGPKFGHIPGDRPGRHDDERGEAFA